MEKIMKIDCNQPNNFTDGLSELVKSTLNDLDINSKKSLEVFSKKFVDFFPENINSLDNIDYNQIFFGKNAPKTIEIYDQLMTIWKESQITDLNGLNEKIDYSDIKNRLKVIDLKLDSLKKS